MKERQTLFIAQMVRALLDDNKTHTRRVVKGSDKWTPLAVRATVLESRGTAMAIDARKMSHGPEIRCPYGMAGDRLWVRETFFAYGRWETRFSAKKGRDEWHFIDMTLECGHQYAYDADGHSFAPHKRSAGVTPCWWKRPAIFMPRAASRITLEIVSVRVERLQDISRGDAMAEGCPFPNMAQGDDPRQWYADLWEQINGPGTWDLNPWVWVIQFKKALP